MPKKITQNVNKDKFLNDLPKVSPEFSKWLNRDANYLSCNLGDIIPIYVDEVLPHEKRKITTAMISHTTTPIAPIFNSLYTEVRSFFVPFRLAADLLNGYKDRKSPWVKVFGEDNKSSDSSVIVSLENQTLPRVSYAFQVKADNYISNVDSDDNIYNFLDLTNITDKGAANYLNLAAYELIYQRHYRNENYEASTDSPLYKHLFNAYNLGESGGFVLPSTFHFEKANREKDYFTGSKPFTQKGDPVKVGLVGEADILVKNNTESAIEEGSIDVTNAQGMNAGKTADLIGIKSGESFALPIVADLKSVNGISIEELRLLIKTQELLEKDAMYGSRYAESLNAHFGCCPIDLTLQDPQELYRTTITSNMQAIFQTSSTSGESSILGTIGANSTTQTEPFVILPETKFLEHGLLIICAVHKLQNVYDSKQFKPKYLFKKARFEFYTPELNDLGFQPVSSLEMRTSSSAVAGFNEAFAEYRYKFNKVHGRIAAEFPYWAPAISNEYSSIAAMYKEGTAILNKALSVTSSTAPQFYDAWGFEEECTKPMSLHSIPGMDGVI